MKNRKNLWRLWAKALGEKASKDDKESDHIAHLRTVIFFTYLITNLFIIAGVIRHWNDGQTINLYQYEVPSHLPQTKEENLLKTNRNFLYD
jgi:hypothetical protein